MRWDTNELPPALAKRLGLDKQKRRKPRELERREQVAVVAWAQLRERKYPALEMLYAVPNGGHRNPRVAAKLKAGGVRRGVPDVCLAAALRGYHGLYIEMKHAGRKQTPTQADFARRLRLGGYCFALCYSADEAIDTLRWYIGMAKTKPDCVLN